jgi:hypothetical protein
MDIPVLFDSLVNFFFLIRLVACPLPILMSSSSFSMAAMPELHAQILP